MPKQCDCHCSKKECRHKATYAINYCLQCLPDQFLPFKKIYKIKDEKNA